LRISQAVFDINLYLTEGLFKVFSIVSWSKLRLSDLSANPPSTLIILNSSSFMSLFVARSFYCLIQDFWCSDKYHKFGVIALPLLSSYLPLNQPWPETIPEPV